MNIKEYSMKIMKYTLWATVGLSLLFASCVVKLRKECNLLEMSIG